jgi:hypothetical protein
MIKKEEAKEEKTLVGNRKAKTKNVREYHPEAYFFGDFFVAKKRMMRICA